MKVFAALISLVVSIVVADMGARLIVGAPSNYLPKIVRIDPRERPSKGLKPGLDTVVSGAYREFRFRVRTDERGFRKSWAPSLSDAPSAEIVFLGDSQTVGVGVEDEQTYPSLVAAATGRAVLNTACYGYNSFEQVQALEKALRDERPKWVVMGFFAGNDPYENDRYDTKPALDDPRKTVRGGRLGAVKDYLVSRSFFYQALIGLRKYDVLNDFLYRIGAVKSDPPKELVVFRSTPDAEQDRYWEKTEGALRDARDRALAAGASFAVLFIPDRYQVDEVYWSAWLNKYRLNKGSYDRDAPNRRIRDICARLGVGHIDATPDLRRRDGSERVYWRIDNHLNRTGNQVIADAVSEWIRITTK